MSGFVSTERNARFIATAKVEPSPDPKSSRGMPFLQYCCSGKRAMRVTAFIFDALRGTIPSVTGASTGQLNQQAIWLLNAERACSGLGRQARSKSPTEHNRGFDYSVERASAA